LDLKVFEDLLRLGHNLSGRRIIDGGDTVEFLAEHLHSRGFTEVLNGTLDVDQVKPYCPIRDTFNVKDIARELNQSETNIPKKHLARKTQKKRNKKQER
jgi:hypothetical protein